MVIVYVALTVVLVGLVVAVVVQRVGLPGVEPPVTTESFTPLPRGGVDLDAITELRFDPALRGYRMSQVDEVVDRLVDEIRLRDAEIARLRGEDTQRPQPTELNQLDEARADPEETGATQYTEDTEDTDETGTGIGPNRTGATRHGDL